MASRLIEDLHPDIVQKYHSFKQGCTEQGIDVLTTCTYRSNEEQNDLYAQGRTKPGKIVTKAKAGQSKHNYTINGKPAAKAFDVVPLRNGKLIWGTSGDGVDDDPSDDLIDDLELWQRVGAIGERCGLEWAGRWKFREYPHFQIK